MRNKTIKVTKYVVQSPINMEIWYETTRMFRTIQVNAPIQHQLTSGNIIHLKPNSVVLCINDIYYAQMEGFDFVQLSPAKDFIRNNSHIFKLSKIDG